MNIPTHVFRLSFFTDIGQSMAINLPNANTNVTNEQVAQAMDTIINSDAVTTISGIPTLRKAARITTHTTTDFELTP